MSDPTAISLFSRRKVLATLMASAAGPVLAGAPLTSERPPRGRGGNVVPASEALVAQSRLSGDIAFVVADASSGEILESRLGDTGLPPASVAKAITALYALDTLGASHRFKTKVIATGGVRKGVVQGDLVLAGGCDPTTDTRAFARLAARLKEAGIREVRGGFYVYENAVASLRVIDPMQPDHVGYNPAVSGIALNFNRVHFEWKRSGTSYQVSLDARAGNYRPDVTLAQMQVVDRRAPVYTYEDSGARDLWTVARGALGREGARWLPVRRPGIYAGEVFATLARSHGIVLRYPKLARTLPKGNVVAEIESDPLSDILLSMLKYSNNLIAEMVGLATTLVRAGKVSSLSASADATNRWAVERLGMQAPAFVDHSGLGDQSRVTAADMVTGLRAIGHSALLRPLLKPVKLLDGQGRPINNHPVQAQAKTGTLNFVSGLAGYITATDDRELVFAIFTADQEKRAAIAPDARERPPGGRTWATRSRRLQRKLIMRWGSAFATDGEG